VEVFAFYTILKGSRNNGETFHIMAHFVLAVKHIYCGWKMLNCWMIKWLCQ